MTEELFEQIVKWQKETFPTATPYSKVKHLEQEVKELIEDIFHEHGKENTQSEFADCFMLLFGAAKAYGMSYEDICQAIETKMEINRKRKWGKPDADGVVNHIKD